MTVLFLANVGNHDVYLTDPSLLPPGLQHRRPSARELGKALLADFERYADALDFPLIGVSLRWLVERKGVPPDDLYVHLFASDQARPPITPPEEWQKDSIPFARVIERYLKGLGLPYTTRVERDGRQHQETRRLRLSKRQIHVHTIEGSPADYDNMLRTFDRELPRMRRWIERERDRVYLEVTGGTPAMTSMLIVAGVDAFGRRTRTLYVERGADRPYAVGIGRRFFARRAQATLGEQLCLFAYPAAKATLERDADLIAPDVEDYAVVAALLDYADRRLAFDFERARDALHRACRYAGPKHRPQIRYRQRELQRPDSAALLSELVHSTRIKYEMGDYADFTQRLFRFQEGCFRHLAEQMGLRYDRGDERHAHMDWVRDVAGLTDFLADYTAPTGRAYGRIDLEGRPLNRVSLGAIVDFFVQRGDPWVELGDPVEKLHRLSAVAELRNKGVAGHGFQGIGREDLEDAFGEDPDAIVPLLEDIYAAIFHTQLGRTPYQAVNVLIRDLLSR